ncbi:ABC transporter substrate-binding protein [Miltoncostaea marina]|uniref:ABC transporter substrate-binding protein n=1 Tax=Miltoncostaea marina TaxID=2843215 RepID=UPI001C3E0CF2|nr:ABC transporter substrate-binding protein [Miltoncostaea marina]
MIRRRHLALVAALAAALLALVAGCRDGGGGTDEGLERVQLVLDWSPNADHAGIYGAIEQDYFADEGLDVRPSVPSDPAAALKQVGAGRAPFAISYEPEVLLARSQGIPVVAIGALVTHPLNSVIVRSDRGIERPRDLEGRTVGAAGVPSDRPLLDAVVRSDGGDPSKVRLRTVGFNLSPALASGRVDAVIGAYWNVELVELERQGVEASALRLEQHGVPDYDELVVVTSDEVARDRPDLVRAFLRGLRAGQDWAATDETGAVEHLLAANPDLQEDTLREQVHLTAPLLSPDDEPTLHLDREEWRAFAGWMLESGLLSRPVDVEAVARPEFLPEDR